MKLNDYWEIRHNADLTETGLTMNITYVKTTWVGFPLQKSCEIEILRDFCRNEFGPEVSYVQGVAPTRSWIISPTNANRFKRNEGTSWGGFPIPAKQIVLKIGNGKIEKEILK